MKELDFRRKVYDRTLKVLMYLCAGITCALLIFLIGYIFYRGVGSVSWELLTTQSSYRNDTIGILPNILNTVLHYPCFDGHRAAAWRRCGDLSD